MAITFNTNLSALTGQRYIGIASGNASSSLAKLSSGSRVPQAKDDAAGLSIGSKLKAEVAALTQDANNAGQAISLLQIADGALSTVGDILQRMKALAVQSSSGQLADADRSLLNQEFTSLQDEIDRVAATANFNGTNLLAGSTAVAANANKLVAANNTTGVVAEASNQIGQGFESIDFNDDFGDGAIKIEYDQATHNLKVTDLVNSTVQTVQLSSTTLASGATETYNFGDVGAKITINSNFAKGTDITSANAAYVNPTAAHLTLTKSITGTGALTGTPTITSTTFNGTGANAFNASQLSGAAIVFDVTSKTAVTASVTIGSHVFNSTASADFSGTTTQALTLSDGKGNSFVISSVISTGFVNGDAYTATVSATGIPTVDSSTNGKPKLVSATVGTDNVAGTNIAFDFGSINDATVVFTTTAASAATASLTIGGHTFTSAAVDLTSTGTKTVVLTDTTTNYTSNSLTFTLNVTGAFANGDGLKVELGDLGQLVGANSTTSGDTTFSFKVGTGTTTNDDISFQLDSATTSALGISTNTIDTAANANASITAVTAAITTVSSVRANVGAAQSRLSFAQASINVSIENTTAAQSSLLDVDVSSEITKFTSQQVLLQAGISLLAQANQQPSLLLKLIQ